MKHLPLGAVAVHSVSVLLMAVVVGILGGEAVILWNLFMLIDFPASVMAAPVFSPVQGWLTAEFGHQRTFTVGYAAYFGLLGGLQYYALVRLLVFLVMRSQAARGSGYLLPQRKSDPM